MPLREELILDFQQAQGALAAFERRVRSATSDVEIQVDTRSIEAASRDLGTMDERLDRVDAGVADVNRELSEMELAAGRSVADFRALADAMDVSEDEARRLSQEILEAANSSARVERAAREVAQQMGLSEDQARQFADQVRRAGNESDTAGQGFGRLGDQLQRLLTFAAVALVFRQIAQGVREAITEFAAFDDALTGSLAIQGDIGALREEFQGLAFDVSETVRFSATEAAEAFFFLASAGFTAEQQLAALPGVAQFAQAGLFDLATATDLLTDAQSALGLTVDDADQNFQNLTRVSDVLVRANVLANASVQQFSESLTNRAATAARIVGVEIEEVVATLAAFADQGVKGQVAGEAFAIVLRDLQRAAVNNADAFARFGIDVFDDAGNIQNLAGIIGDLEGALAGLSDEQIRVTLTTLGFQERSLANLLTLIGTSDQIARYEAELRNAGGTTAEVADNQLASLGAALDIAGNRIDNVRIQVGEALSPAIRTLAEDVLPALVLGLQPAIARLGEFSEEIAAASEAAADEGGIATWVSATLLGLGTVADAFGTFADVGQIALNAVTLDLEGIGDEFESINQRFQDDTIRVSLQGIVAAIDKGRDPIDAFGIGLSNIFQAADFLKDGTDLLEDSFFQLAGTAGLTRNQLIATLPFFIAQAEAAGATADEIQFLLRTLRELRPRPIDFDRGSFGQLRRDAAAANDELRNFVVPTALEDLQREARDAGISMAELVTSNEDAANSFVDLVPEIEQSVVVIDGLREGAIEASAVISEALAGAIVDVASALEDANEDGRVSGQEYLTTLRTQQVELLTFRANILALAVDFPATANALFQAGADQASGAAADLVANLDLARESEAVLTGQDAELSALFEETFDGAVNISDMDGPALQLLQAFGVALADPTLTPILQAAIDAQLARLRFGGTFDIFGGPNVGLPTGIPSTPTSSTTGETGTSPTVNLTINNPQLQDLDSDVARALQALNGVRSAYQATAG